MKNVFYLLVLYLYAYTAAAQTPTTASLSGHIRDTGGPLAGVNISSPSLRSGSVTDESGHFQLSIPANQPIVVEISFLGYRNQQHTFTLQAGEEKHWDVVMENDVLGLDAVVVSATRSSLPIYQAPVIVSRINSRLFERSQSLSLAEGLNFSPGLRLENNCQNCGFTQVRMNGLDGPYSQILIDGRAIFSALAGVYGLEMIPANMIERVEVVRGGGSVLYGGNAIAGTINIITKDPVANSLSVASNLAVLRGGQPDQSLQLNGSIVSPSLDKGISFFAFRRNRQPWDANEDGFSELTQLRNSTLGMTAFLKPDERSRLSVNLFLIDEFRRGGSDFELPPHQAAVAEQLQHHIVSGGINYERYSRDQKRKLAVYTALQATLRDSYYGAGGRVLAEGDSLTVTDLLALRAYGQSEDLSSVTGLQYAAELGQAWSLIGGTELQYNQVDDRMPGYARSIRQRVGVWGNYLQLQWAPDEKWSLLLGSRMDRVQLEGDYDFSGFSLRNDRILPVFVPRFTAKYSPSRYLSFRTSYAEGYRAPQAFDEDLHIETVGGAARFVLLSPELQAERSRSFNASVDYTYRREAVEWKLVVDGFYNRLQNPFVTVNPRELPNGVAIISKQNGGGAVVQGLNLEFNAAYGRQWQLQTGFTLQSARYDEPLELWSPETPDASNADSITSTQQLLRNPNAYGFFTASWQPVAAFDASLTGVYTGPMQLAHVIDPTNEYTVVKTSEAFMELGFRLAWRFDLRDDYQLQLTAGVHNLFDSYQQDLDRGAERDAGYVYGPARPRSIFFGVKITLGE